MTFIYEDSTAQGVPRRPAPFFGAAAPGPTYVYSEVDKENLPAHMLRAGCPSSRPAAGSAAPSKTTSEARPPHRRTAFVEIPAHVQQRAADRRSAAVPLKSGGPASASASAAVVQRNRAATRMR